MRTAIAAVLVFFAARQANSYWARDLPPWVESRGLAGRRLLLSSAPLPKENAVPGIGFMENTTAKRLTERYHLH